MNNTPKISVFTTCLNSGKYLKETINSILAQDFKDFEIIIVDNSSLLKLNMSSYKNVKVILINIFGGIVRCDRVANGVVQAVKDLGLKVPVVVRLEGNSAKKGSSILAESNSEIISLNDLEEAAKKAVELSK